jgi:hypothetical protein
VERISAAPAIFNSLSWRVSGLEVESEDGGGAADRGELKEISATSASKSLRNRYFQCKKPALSQSAHANQNALESIQPDLSKL